MPPHPANHLYRVLVTARPVRLEAEDSSAVRAAATRTAPYDSACLEVVVEAHTAGYADLVGRDAAFEEVRQLLDVL